MDELFKVRHHLTSLAISDEQDLIIEAQTGNENATWKLLIQYSGLLQKTAYDVQARLARMTPDQIEDLQSELVLAAIEGIKNFDLTRFVRLSQVLPGRLKDVALEVTTALTIPRGTLALWFKIWRAGEHDFEASAALAPGLGMSTDTFRAITHTLEYAGSEWVTIPYTAGKPTADAETHRLAHLALDTLTATEREVIEFFYGFRGDPKTDQEVSEMQGTAKSVAVRTRQRGLERMRMTLANQPA